MLVGEQGAGWTPIRRWLVNYGPGRLRRAITHPPDRKISAENQLPAPAALTCTAVSVDFMPLLLVEIAYPTALKTTQDLKCRAGNEADVNLSSVRSPSWAPQHRRIAPQ